LGRVASHQKWEQALEQIFVNAEDWKAILLIDEAEIVLEKRTFERMIHNSWISGMTTVAETKTRRLSPGFSIPTQARILQGHSDLDD